MSKATPLTSATGSGVRSNGTSSARVVPSWFDLHAVVSTGLCDEIAALTAEAGAMETQVRDFATRCFRALAGVQVAELEANLEGLGDEGLQLVEEHAGVKDLAGRVAAIIDHLDAARMENPASLPDWAAAEGEASGSSLVPWADDTDDENDVGEAS